VPKTAAETAADIGIGLPSALDLKFSAAEKFFAGKLTLTKAEWLKLRAEAQLYGFTVAHITSIQLLQDIRDEIQKAIVTGSTLADFRKSIPQLMAKHGWSGTTPWHIETIFRTNVQMAYGMGQLEGLLAVKDVLPFWQYSAIHDKRVRPTHAELDGRIYPADAEFWQTHFPPWEFNCRCDVIPLTEAEVPDGATIHTDAGPQPTTTFTGPGTLLKTLQEKKLTAQKLAETMLPKLPPAAGRKLMEALGSADDWVPLEEDGVAEAVPVKLLPVGPTEEEIAAAIEENKVFDKKAKRLDQIRKARATYAAKKKAEREAAKAAAKAGKTVTPPQEPVNTSDPLQRLSRLDYLNGRLAGVDVPRDETLIEGNNLNVRLVTSTDGRKYYEFYGKVTDSNVVTEIAKSPQFREAGPRVHYGVKPGVEHVEGSQMMSADFRPRKSISIGNDVARTFQYEQGPAELRVNRDPWSDAWKNEYGANDAMTLRNSFRIRIPRTGDDALDFSRLRDIVRNTPLEGVIDAPGPQAQIRTGIMRALAHEEPQLINPRGATFAVEGVTQPPMRMRLRTIPADIARKIDPESLTRGVVGVRAEDLRKLSVEELSRIGQRIGLGEDFGPGKIKVKQVKAFGYSTQTMVRDINHKEVIVFHGTGEAPMSTVVDIIEEGKVTSSYHRIRHGVSGVLNHADMDSGGADSLFTRIAVKNKRVAMSEAYMGGRVQFVWDGATLDRLDLYAYNGDNYGRTFGPTVANRQTVAQLISDNRITYNRNNEVMFRHGLDFTDLRFIVARDQRSYEELLEELRRRGITRINGRNIEDIVVMRYHTTADLYK
jgi:SPP1 gp7 family putative phage head morphogenesis protein